VGSNTAGGMDVSLVSAVCCHAKVSASGLSLVQRSPTECVCVCVCAYHKTSITRRPWPSSDYCAKGEKGPIPVAVRCKE